MLYGANSVLMNSRIAGSAGNGVLVAAGNCQIVNNLITDCDYMGSYASPIHLLWDSVLVYKNTVNGTGRDGICWDWHRAKDGWINNKWNGSFHYSTISYNHIFNYGYLQADLAGMYVCCGVDMTNTQVHHNKTHDCEAAYWPYDIYFDNGTFGACSYDNVGTYSGVHYNGGTAGTCPSNIVHTWLDSAGCTFENTPDTAWTTAARHGFFSAGESLRSPQKVDALLFTIDGRLVRQWNSVENRALDAKINAAGLPARVYLLLMRDKESTSAIRTIVVKKK